MSFLLRLGGSEPFLSSCFSVSYLVVFLPLTILFFTLCPGKGKKWVLLACSYGFFWLISSYRILYLFAETLLIYAFGLWLDRCQKECKEKSKGLDREARKIVKKQYAKKQRRGMLFGVLLVIGILVVVKYTGFFAENLNQLLDFAACPFILPVPKFVMPIGISFFTLQAASYLLDIHRGTIEADRNLGRVALFLAFFPQITEGPICRYEQTAEKLWEVKPIAFENLKMGLQRILYGLMKKMVVADRLNAFVEAIFGGYEEYSGGMIALGAVAYTIQLYMDFSGAMDGVCGTAQIFGISMPENFSRPFFSRSVSEFWHRWHISLGTWFKDYIFYPVSVSGPMKDLMLSFRKKFGNHAAAMLVSSVALFCVWSLNGLWHGAAWNFILFGMYHFILIAGGNLFTPLFERTKSRLKIPGEAFWWKGFQIVRTSVLVVFGELIFRAEGAKAALSMFGKVLSDFTFPSLSPEQTEIFSLDRMDVLVVFIVLLIVFLIGVFQEKGIRIRTYLEEKPIWVRWGVYYGLILFILLCGAYGQGYLPVDPMYANF